MKYFLCKNDNDSLVILKEITWEEYRDWKKSVEQLKYYTLAKHFRDIAITNGLELEKFLKDIAKISDNEFIKKSDTSAIGTESNRLMLNYLVAFRTYVDNLQAYSKHIKNGDNFKKNILSYIYDNDPAYPFLSKLRNFATHCSMVFDSISSENGRVRLECSKEHLLEYAEWNDKSKAFIQLYEEYLPIADLIEHNNVLLMSIYLGFLTYFADDIQDMHKRLTTLMNQYQVSNPLFIECPSLDTFDGSVSGLALSVLKEATDELAQMPNVTIEYLNNEQVIKGESI